MTSNLLRPATFEERGAVVPFTSPLLSLARVRADPREKLVLMMPAFGSEQGSAYVAPWKSVPELGRITVHDRALHHEVALREAITPERIRGVSLKVALTGLAGPAAADAARRAAELDRARLAELHKALTRAVMAGLDTAAAAFLDQPSDDWRAKAKPLVAAAGKAWSIEPNELQTRIEVLGALLVALGLKGGTRPGRMRLLRERFPRFRAAMAEWAEFEPTDLAGLGIFAAEIADSYASVPFQRMPNVWLEPSREAGDARRPGLGGRRRHPDRRPGLVLDRPAAVQLPVRRRRLLGDQGGQGPGHDRRRRLPEPHAGLLGVLRRDRRRRRCGRTSA